MSTIDRTAKALFLAMMEGGTTKFTGLDGSGTWETATSQGAKAKWKKIISAPLRELAAILREIPIDLLKTVAEKEIEAEVGEWAVGYTIRAIADWLERQA